MVLPGLLVQCRSVRAKWEKDVPVFRAGFLLVLARQNLELALASAVYVLRQKRSGTFFSPDDMNTNASFLAPLAPVTCWGTSEQDCSQCLHCLTEKLPAPPFDYFTSTRFYGRSGTPKISTCSTLRLIDCSIWGLWRRKLPKALSSFSGDEPW